MNFPSRTRKGVIMEGKLDTHLFFGSNSKVPFESLL